MVPIVSRVYISAAKKSSGKTTISIGLCAAIAERGLQVQPFKKGPDYIDPMWLSESSGRPCINLDFNTMPPDELLAHFNTHQRDADIAIIEGNKGLFDGVDLHGSDSNAALAKLLKTPVVLVLDAEGVTRGIVPLILGYQHFDKDVEIAGVILNNVKGSRHESKLRTAIEYYTDVNVLGGLTKQASHLIPERHLGLMTNQEDTFAQAHIQSVKQSVIDQIDVNEIISLSAVPPLPVSQNAISYSVPVKSNNQLKIGVPRDAAFCFYYDDDLKEFERQGATLDFFSILHDTELPTVDALFIGGGFPETHCEQLAANSAMKEAIHAFAQSGKPIYAECGGLMYLSRNITWHNQTHQMVGALPADTTMLDKPVGRGYVRIEPTPLHPWIDEGQNSDLLAGESINAHEFHYSRLENISDEVSYAYTVTRGHGVNGRQDGLVYNSIFASYSHLRNSRSNPWVRQFLNRVSNAKTNIPLTT